MVKKKQEIQMVKEEYSRVRVNHFDGNIDTTLYFKGVPILFVNGVASVDESLVKELKEGRYIK